jgi:hypothetical protein
MGVRINSTTLVRDFVTESDEIMAEASGLVVGAEETKRYFHHNELIVDVTMAVPTEQVVRTIKEFHTRHYKGNRVTGSDIENVQERIKRRTFEATGSGVPPKKYMEQVAPQFGIAPPEWADERLTAEGHGTDEEIETPQGRLRALRAATNDARRQLVERLHGLHLTSDTLIKDYVIEREEIRTQVQALIAGSVVDDRRIEGDTATVLVSVSGPQLWSTLHSQLTIEARH